MLDNGMSTFHKNPWYKKLWRCMYDRKVREMYFKHLKENRRDPKDMWKMFVMNIFIWVFEDDMDEIYEDYPEGQMAFSHILSKLIAKINDVDR